MFLATDTPCFNRVDSFTFWHKICQILPAGCVEDKPTETYSDWLLTISTKSVDRRAFHYPYAPFQDVFNVLT